MQRGSCGAFKRAACAWSRGRRARDRHRGRCRPCPHDLCQPARRHRWLGPLQRRSRRRAARRRRGRRGPGARRRGRRYRPARPGADRPMDAQRLRAAGQRRVEQRAGPVARPGRGASTLRARCARRCEYSSCRSSSAGPISDIGIGADAEARRRAARKAAPAKMPSPRLASVIGHRPATAPLRGQRGGLGLGHVGGVDQAPARRRPAAWSSSHSTGRAPRPGEAVLDLLHLLGDVDVDRAVRPPAAATAAQLVRRHGAQAVRRDADHGVRQRRDRCAAALEQPREAVDVVEEPPLARARRLRRRSRHGRRRPAAASGRCRSRRPRRRCARPSRPGRHRAARRGRGADSGTRRRG